MTSKERKEIRYQRRKQKRENKILIKSNQFANIDKSFSFSNALYYADKCCNGVKWKKSTQLFKLHLFTNVANACYNIKNATYVVGKTYQFTICERGKKRTIDAPHIKDRLIHKILANDFLLPAYTPHLIYDNGASQKNKGFTFALKRVKHNLLKNYKKYKDGYVVLIDYSKFFENCSHDVVKEIHKKYIKNDYINRVIEDYLFICKGIALGVEIAQKEASIIPNKLDHFLQDRKLSGIRYMDDTVFFIDNLDKANKLLDEYISLAKSLSIIINKRKTKNN